MKTQALKRENEHCLDLEAELRLLSPYYANNAWKLRGIINNALKGIGGLTGADYDEFMSVAGEALTNALMIFDENTGDFDGIAYVMITRKVYTQLTAMNRIKRGGVGEDGQGEKKVSVPIDDLVGGDLVKAGTSQSAEMEALEHMKCYSECMTLYLERIPSDSRRILFLLADGYSEREISRMLNMDNARIKSALSTARRYENTKLLHR